MSEHAFILTVVSFSGAIQIVGLTILGVLLYRMWEQTGAVGAATFLQGKKLGSILNEVRQELTKLS